MVNETAAAGAQLKGCPFCGFSSQYMAAVTTGAGMFDANSCQCCGATGPYNASPTISGDRNERWNTRTEQPRPTSALAAMAERAEAFGCSADLVQWMRNPTDPTGKADVGLHIVFDGPPGPEAGRFVEVETPDGRSVNAGAWHPRDDGYWELRLAALTTGADGLADDLDNVITAWAFANDIDGAARNDLMRRCRAARTGADGVAAENEACAALAEDYPSSEYADIPIIKGIAHAIRARMGDG